MYDLVPFTELAAMPVGTVLWRVQRLTAGWNRSVGNTFEEVRIFRKTPKGTKVVLRVGKTDFLTATRTQCPALVRNLTPDIQCQMQEDQAVLDYLDKTCQLSERLNSADRRYRSGKAFRALDTDGRKQVLDAVKTLEGLFDKEAGGYEKLKCGTKSEDLLALPFYPGDRVWVVNAQESRHYTKGFYESFEHVWLIRNNGTVPWEGRKMICMSQKEQSVKINAYTFDVPQTDPGEDAEIKMQVDPRGREGAFESVWKMIDSDGNDCFPNEKWLFNFTVTVINQSRVSAEVML